MNLRLEIPVASLLFVTLPMAAAAQSQAIEIRAMAEFRVSSNSSPEITERVASALAKRRALNEAALRLSQMPEIKNIPIQNSQLEALLPPIVALSVESMRSFKDAGQTVYHADALAGGDVWKISRGLYLLLKDPNAYADLVAARKQSIVLEQELTKLVNSPDSLNETEKNSLLNRLTANDLIVRVYGDLARIEESPASVRVATRKGVQRSIAFAERAVILARETPQAYLALGDALMASDQAAPAEVEYRQALLLDSRSASAHIKLGEAMRVQEKLPEAVEEFQEALRIEPKSAMAHTDLGFVLAAQQNNSGAVAEYREAVKCDPDYLDAHNYLAITLARQGNLPEAVDEFREMVRIDPDSALGYYNMAIALADMEKDAEASEALRHVLRINPLHYNAHFNIGEMLRLEGKLDEAVKQFKEYLRLAPDNTPQALRNIQRAREFVRTHDDP